MSAFESKNERALSDTCRVGERGRVEAALGARQAMSAETLMALGRKSVDAISLNALLANKLLAALPGDSFERLLPHLEPAALSAGEDLYRSDRGVPYAYFPESAVISQLHVLEDGNMTEAAMIGREGLVGLSALLNASLPTYWTRVLIAGSALRIRVDILKQEFGRGGALQRTLLAYVGARITQLSQRAVCSGRHKVGERLCCWLLMLHDRVGEDQLQLTHEIIASHLGVRRAGITEIANALRDRGIIAYNRGLIRIIDRQRLEAVVCECYRMLGRSAARVM